MRPSAVTCSRSWILTVSMLATIAAAGCSLARTGIAEGDAGMGRDARVVEPDGGGDERDAGPICIPSECDDGNPCTDDGCGATACVHTNNTDACDDGVLCNGDDTCGGGSCSVHDGVDPCPGASHCDTAMDACVGCASDDDCPDTMLAPFGDCAYGSACAESGSRSRDVTSYRCSSEGVCEATTMIEVEACTRDTDETTCAPTELTDFTACMFTASDVCDETGTRSRTVTVHTCSAGSCGSSSMEQIEDCTRDTDGTVCGTPMTVTGTCEGFSDTCDESGTRMSTTSTPRCTGGTCGPVTTMMTEACARDTDGTSCGSCGAWGMCSGGTLMDPCHGTQTRACPTCGSGSCGMRTEMQSCVRDGGACTLPSECDCVCASMADRNGTFHCRPGTCDDDGDCNTSGSRVDTGVPCRCGG